MAHSPGGGVQRPNVGDDGFISVRFIKRSSNIELSPVRYHSYSVVIVLRSVGMREVVNGSMNAIVTTKYITMIIPMLVHTPFHSGSLGFPRLTIFAQLGSVCVGSTLSQ